jgi:UDP-N-acetylmuramate--alanine ligase/UDP-N-acetylglucosamine--N-acetylmuramyl-(pentapeptide) pyrophosphoryl-undecaprenol N-acetylglucosamine transferase
VAEILLAGGGTAGHVNPLLATAALLRTRGHTVSALGTAEGLETDLVPRAGLELLTVPRVPLPRKISGAWLRLPGNLKRAIAAAEHAIDVSNADAVVGFGGYVSTPAYIAARRRGIPWIVHEANARPGLANRWGARGAARVAITFEGTPLPRAQVTGLPLRPEIRALADVLAQPDTAIEARAQARLLLGWPADAPTLLVTGGSLGAASLNAATVGAARALVGHGVHVLHLTGCGKSGDAERLRGDLAARERPLYVIQEYTHDMATAFAAADAVVCRAGAATVSEISALGIPAVYVPLPHGNGEQSLNAAPAVRAGAAVLVADEDLTAAALEQQAERLVLDPEARAAAVAAAAGIGIRDGAERLVALIEEVLV